jgi:hypothetical protein
MYHPELQPELAAKNLQNFTPLKINRDERMQKLKIKKANEKVKTLADEITIIRDNSKKRSADNLASTILEKVDYYGKIDKNNFTSRHEVQPILEEISDIGVKYLIPNFEKQKTDSARMFNKAYGNIIVRELPVPDVTSTEDELYDLHFKSEEDVSSNKATYNYIKEINKESEKNLSLRDLIVEMKKEKKFNPVFDIRSIPNEAESIKKDSDKYVELSKEKTELSNLLKKIESSKEDELSHILRDFQVEDREELIENINNSIQEIERELYLTKNQLSTKKEKKKVFERKKQMLNIVKSLKESHQTKKKGVRKQTSKSGLRKRTVEKKIKLNM